MRSDCVVVGGGVIGLSIAWELSNRGLAVTVLDQQQIGRGCSWAGAGILPPARFDTAFDPIDKLRGLSHGLHPIWHERLLETTGIDNGLRRCGGYYVATSAGESAALVGQASYWKEYGIEAEKVEILSFLEREPAISQEKAEQIRTAWWLPDEMQLCPPDHLRALAEACRVNGCEVLDMSPVHHIEKAETGIWITKTTQDVIEAEFVVLCCGAWASRFPVSVGCVRDVYPVRGQAILFEQEPRLLASIVNEGHRYLVPRDNGIIYVGSNEEEVGLNEGTTPEVIQSLREWAMQWVPQLANAKIKKTFSGLRPGSFDGFPMIGPSSEHPGLYFATGHFRSGLHLSCATAVVIADTLTGGRPTFVETAVFGFR